MPKIPAKWLAIIQGIPGYDPVATAAPGDHFSPAAASKAIEFIEEACHHVKGAMAGEKFILEPWERTIVANLFGWLRADGMRRYRFIRKRVGEIADEYPMAQLAVDRLFQGAQLCQDLADDGFNVVPFGMGYVSMAAPTEELERLVNRGEFHHGGNPVMRWMASNVTVKIDPAGNMKPDKSRSTEKIDGVVSAIMALGRAIVQEKPATSVYNTRGIIYI